MSKFDLISRIKKIISEQDPNQIKSISCNFDILDEKDQEYTYQNLIKYWKTKEDENDELSNEYYNIKKLNSNKDISLKTDIGVVSLFYFKDKKRFLAVGKHDNDLFHFSIKCPEYQKVLSSAISDQNELFVLTYWIM